MLSYPLFLSTRSGGVWRVNSEGTIAVLRRTLGDDPNVVPSSGWQFRNNDTQEYEDDPLFACHPLAASAPCKVTVSLSGLAKETEGECEGEYKETGLMSVGKKVGSNDLVSFFTH